MWIYVKEGFFSIVEHSSSKKHVVVRARVKGDLEKVFNGATFAEGPSFTPDSDYRYRGTISKDELAAVLMGKAKTIDYKNFKNAINDKERREYWYEQVWETMANMQDHLAQLEDLEKIGVKA